MMQLNAKQSFFIVVSGYLLGSLTLWSNSWVLGGGNLYNLYMRRNIGPAAAGSAGPAATALLTSVPLRYLRTYVLYVRCVGWKPRLIHKRRNCRRESNLPALRYGVAQLCTVAKSRPAATADNHCGHNSQERQQSLHTT